MEAIFGEIRYHGSDIRSLPQIEKLQGGPAATQSEPPTEPSGSLISDLAWVNRLIGVHQMFTKFKRGKCLLAVAVISIAGCSDTNSVTNPLPKPTAPVLNAGFPQTPEEAIKVVVDGIKASKPLPLWNAMTTEDQSGINHIFRDFAKEADPEIWQKTVENLKKLALLAETKKDFLLRSPLVRSMKQFKPDELKAMWDPVLKLLKTALASELVDQEKMKNFDGRAFFDGTGAKLFAQLRELTHTMKDDPLKGIKDWSVTVNKLSDERALAELSLGGPKKRTIEIPLLVQDGRWTTERFVLVRYLINSQINPITIRFLPYCLPEWKDQYMADMRRIGLALDKLQAAKTSDDFQMVVSTQVLPFVLQKTVQFNQKRKPLSALETQSQARKKATAMILIKGDHFADEPGIRELMTLFQKIGSEKPSTTSGPYTVDQTTVFLISPVSDPTGLSKQIHIGKVTKVDVKRNQIYVELPPSPAGEKTTADAGGAAKPAP